MNPAIFVLIGQALEGLGLLGQIILREQQGKTVELSKVGDKIAAGNEVLRKALEEAEG